MTDEVPVPQQIEATVGDDATGTIEVDGVAQRVAGWDERAVRSEILAYGLAMAKDAGGAVRLHIRGRSGDQLLEVFPDGHIESVDGPAIDGAAAVPESDPRHEGGPDSGLDEEAEPEREVDGEPEPEPEPEPDPEPKSEPEPAPDSDPGLTPQPVPADEIERLDWSDLAPIPEIPEHPDDVPVTGPMPVHVAAEAVERISAPPAAPGPKVETAPVPVSSDLPGLQPMIPMTETADATVRRPSGRSADLPTLTDLLHSKPKTPLGPATMGWRGRIRRLTGGLISPKPGPAELLHLNAIERVQRSLSGPRTIVVINPKGGAHKTTATLLLAATFGSYRGGYTLAWDNNETRGTLGWRSQPSKHSRTAVDLLGDLERFDDIRNARVGDLDGYVRGQGDSQFDVLASDEDATASSTIDDRAFTRLHDTLNRFYRVIVIDTGNNMRASNWVAAVEAADQLVIVSTVREDTAASAAWLIDGLREKGQEDKVRDAVTVLSAPAKVPDAQLSRRLHGHFATLTRTVIDVPHDEGLVEGGVLDFARLAPATREAWLRVTAAVADGL